MKIFIAAIVLLITTQVTNIVLQSLADHNFKPAKNWEQRRETTWN